MNRAVIGTSAIVIVAALADLWVTLRPAPDPIPAATMAEAASRVRSLRKSGDRLVHSPLFSVAELAPLGELRATPDKPPDDILASRRVLVIDRDDARMGGLGAADEEVEIGEIVLRIFEPEGSGTANLYDLMTQFDEKTLRIERPRGRVASRCTAKRNEGGYECPGQPEWLYVARRTLTIDGNPRSCLWAHPTTNGAVVFTIPAQPAPPPGRRLRLALHAGMADDAVRGTPDGATVRLDVEQGGRVGTVDVGNRVGWFSSTHDVAGDSPIDIVITTPRDGRRHLCIDAQVTEVAVP